MLRGAIGILSRKDRFLLIRRARGVAKAGYWCFPGGHVEPGETPKAAVRRELSEELGLDVVPTERLGSIRVPDTNHILAVWRARCLSGELRLAAAEVAEARWMLADEIRAVTPSLPSNDVVLQMLGV